MYKTIPDVIAEALKKEILAGELVGGKQLKQEKIAKRYNVSMTPVREALKKLESQGFVKFYPNKGAIVSKLSEDEAKELFEIRLLLERGALEFAIDNLTDEDIEQARLILMEMDKKESSEKISELNWEFHCILYKPCQRENLLELMKNVHLKAERYMKIYLINMNYHSTSQAEHYELLEACKNKDKKLACEILKKHMETASEILSELLKNREVVSQGVQDER
jgi:DNA-binding GntR family transcriptional regulator